MKKSILIVVACLLFVPVANSSIINFNTPTLIDGIQRVESYTESGVIFTGAFNHVDAGLGSPSNGTAFMQYEGFSSVNFGMVDDSFMSLVSIDLAELSSAPVSITFIALASNSEMISQTFTTDGIFGSGNDFETFFFDSAFSAVDYVYISNDTSSANHSFAFDNININPVPIPAALWLFISGLIGLVGFSRSKK